VTPNGYLFLFLYTLVLVGLVTGAQMLYVGAIARRPMRLGGNPLPPDRLVAAGSIFAVAGVLATAVMAVEILSGAAGTDIRGFIAATLLTPPIVVWYNMRRDRAATV
jgi:hypothetical protein